MSKSYDEYQVIQLIIDKLQSDKADIQKDNNGQFIIYTGFFEHEDGSIHDEADPKHENS